MGGIKKPHIATEVNISSHGATGALAERFFLFPKPLDVTKV
jgi:hypothetical protein